VAALRIDIRNYFEPWLFKLMNLGCFDNLTMVQSIKRGDQAANNEPSMPCQPLLSSTAIWRTSTTAVFLASIGATVVIALDLLVWRPF
jgi:hypothetical protein